MDLNHNNDERKNQDNSRNDIRNAFRGEKLNGKGIAILSDTKPIKHEKDTSEIKLNIKRHI